MLGRQVFDEARWDAADPLAVNPAVGGVKNGAMPPCAGDGDIGEAAFFLQRRQPAFVDRALRWEHAFFPADAEDIVEFQPLGGVDCHDRHGLPRVRAIIVHDQTDMFEEIAERFVFLHRAGKFGQVFGAARAFG